jgi:two-component system sensor histidine kinase RegB
MTSLTNASEIFTGPGKANLRRLWMMRNFAICAQISIILIIRYGYQVDLPIGPLLVVIAGLGIHNAFTWLRLRSGAECGDHEFLLQLLADIVALTAALYFTGGATNPFVGLFLLPLVVSATVLRRRYVWLIVGITVMAYSGLLQHYVPLPRNLNETTMGFDPMVTGMWMRFVINALLVAYFVVNMAEALRQRERSLAQQREEGLRNNQLVALGMLSAGAAHELGTPLATLATLIGELRRDCRDNASASTQDYLGLMRSQIDRCKQALAEISASAGEFQADSGKVLPVRAFLLETLDHWNKMRPGIHITPQLDGDASQPTIVAERTLSQAIIVILNNAADASPQFIELHASWGQSLLTLEICDRGVGLTLDVFENIGQSPVSTKEHGLGLGLYLAYAAIKRLGGEVSLTNRPHGGTRARVSVPLRQLGAS